MFWFLWVLWIFGSGIPSVLHRGQAVQTSLAVCFVAVHGLPKFSEATLTQCLLLVLWSILPLRHWWSSWLFYVRQVSVHVCFCRVERASSGPIQSAPLLSAPAPFGAFHPGWCSPRWLFIVSSRCVWSSAGAVPRSVPLCFSAAEKQSSGKQVLFQSRARQSQFTVSRLTISNWFVQVGSAVSALSVFLFRHHQMLVGIKCSS